MCDIPWDQDDSREAWYEKAYQLTDDEVKGLVSRILAKAKLADAAGHRRLVHPTEIMSTELTTPLNDAGITVKFVTKKLLDVGYAQKAVMFAECSWNDLRL